MDQIGRELVENFDTILDTIHDDILIADGSGRVIRLSPTFEEVYGLEKEKAIDLPQFEKLAGNDRLYCIRHPESKKNVRVIYVIEEGAIILLTAFLEKNRGDYKRAVDTALERLKWLDR